MSALVKNDNRITSCNWFEKASESLFGFSSIMYQETKLFAATTKLLLKAAGPNENLSNAHTFSKTGASFLGWFYLPVSFFSAVKGMNGVIKDPSHVRPWLSSAQKTADFVSTAFYTVGPLCMKAVSGPGGIGAGVLKDTFEVLLRTNDLRKQKEPANACENEQQLSVGNLCVHDRPPTAQQECENFQETRILNILQLTKAVASAVAGVFGVLALAGILASNPIVAVALLGIACTTAILSITAHFYERCMEHQPQKVYY